MGGNKNETNAIELIEREASEFDEAAVEALLAKPRELDAHSGGCPGSRQLLVRS